MKAILFLLPATLFFTSIAGAAGKKVFLEKDGIVAIEAESTASRLGEWKLKTDVEEYQGEGHLEFTGNKPETGPPKSPLKYYFKINKPGKYQLTLRGRKRLISERADICNDCYVALDGDFENATTTTMDVLKSDTKMFGGHADSWGWTTRLDVHHKKHPAIYLLKAGETYEFTISGRSQNFNIDRILFVHEDTGLNKAQRENPPESRVAGRSEKIKTARVKRSLKNQEGKVVEAELMELKGDTLVCLIKGRRYEIPVSTLRPEDQDFLKKWAAGENSEEN